MGIANKYIFCCLNYSLLRLKKKNSNSHQEGNGKTTEDFLAWKLPHAVGMAIIQNSNKKKKLKPQF